CERGARFGGFGTKGHSKQKPKVCTPWPLASKSTSYTFCESYTFSERNGRMFVVEELDARNYSVADARAIAELLCLVWPKPEKPVDVRQKQLLALGEGYRGPESQQ